MDAQRMNIIHRRQFGLPLTDLFPPHGTPKTTDSSSTTASVTSSSTSDTSTSTSTSTSSSDTPTTTSTSTSTTTSTTPTSDPSTSAAVTAPSTSSTITVFQTASVPATISPSPSTTAVAATNQSFLQNKALSGVVFALAGVVGLVLIIIAATFMIRRRRSNKLLNEALSFDAVNMGNDAPDMMETGRRRTNDRTSTSTGHASHGNGPLVNHAAPFADYAPSPMPYTPTSVRSQKLSQHSSPQQRPYPAGAQPFAQKYDWTKAPVYPSAAHSQSALQANQRTSEDDKSRRSGSSSGEFQFASPLLTHQAPVAKS